MLRLLLTNVAEMQLVQIKSVVICVIAKVDFMETGLAALVRVYLANKS